VSTPTPTAPRRGWRRGQAYVEFALTALALVLLMFGIFEMCLLFYDYDLVSYAASSGARWAMVHGANSSSPATSADVQNYVQGIVPGLNPARLGVNAYWPQGNKPAASLRLTSVTALSSCRPSTISVRSSSRSARKAGSKIERIAPSRRPLVLDAPAAISTG